MLDPIVLFFLLGVLAHFAKSDLKLPEALTESISIYLLLAIGLKGGVTLHDAQVDNLGIKAGSVIVLGCVIALLAYAALRALRFGKIDAASICAHYGSVSVVTYAVCTDFLAAQNIAYEPYTAMFVALMEAPGIVVGVLLARMADRANGDTAKQSWGALAHEVFLNKGVFLLLGGLTIGAIAGEARLAPFFELYVDLFKGVLGLFLIGLGLQAASHLAGVLPVGMRLIGFALAAPLAFGVIGVSTGWLLGLSVGGMTVLGTLAASASYIAAPAAMRVAVPQSNPALGLGAALGITFPLNILFGIPLYAQLAEQLH
ncbi:MAG: sodium-dependent bicarbonate transport family permease [Burkholderiaceae bacterium]